MTDNRQTLNSVSKESLDLRTNLIKRLVQEIPEVASDGKIDLDKLKQILGDQVEESPERYNFTWHGKAESIKLAQKPTTATLKPNKEKSRDWDKTQNLYVEGDNLEVLKILQKSYSNKVKLIYIDPPYNTGKDFVYKDNFHDSMENYLEQTGQVDEGGYKKSTNTEKNGRYHTDWLSMMYPRLKLARNLLTDDGVIFISIDDTEQANLKKMADEIFGENNLVQEIAWRRSDNQANIGVSARVKEYILVYAKSKVDLSYGRLPLSEGATREYRYKDKDGRKFRRGILLHKTRGRYTYSVTTKSGYVLTGPWMVSEDQFWRMDRENQIYWTTGGNEQPYSKIYLSEVNGAIPNDFWGIEFGTNQRASLDVEKLFNSRVFDFPKPVKLLKNIVNLGSSSDSIVMDFFSGAASTADAVMQQNVEDDGNRKFIMVQLPEQLDEKSEAYKDGYRTIPDIAEERIRRAGDKLISENPLFADKLDTGFKVFELDKSNIRKWNTDPDKLAEQLKLGENNLTDDSSTADLVYEIMLKQGLELTLPIEKESLDQADIYKIAYGALFIVLGTNITAKVADRIVKVIKEEKLEEVSVVLQDTGFANDSDKLNTIEALNANGVDYKNILSI